MKRIVATLLSVLLFTPSFALAQAAKAGVVTTLEGNVTARRVAIQDPVPLKFKDDVFLQDTVTTGDKSLARMLLGGKAVITVRERSILTITEVPGRSTIELETGKFALAVAREKMRPGEEIQIRTPNAIAGVRGTVVITEVNRQTAQLGRAAAGVLTRFYVLRGTITAQPLDIGTRQPLGTPLAVGAMQAYSGAGAATPNVAPVPPDQVGQITSGLQPSGPKGGGEAGQEQVKTQAVQTAVALVGTLTGTGATQMAAIVGSTPTLVETAAFQPPPTAPLTPLDAIEAGDIPVVLSGLIEFINQQLTLNAPVLAVDNIFASPVAGPAILVDHSALTFVGNGLDVVRVIDPGAAVLLGPLASFRESFIQTTGSLLEMFGSSATLFGLSQDALLQLTSTTTRTANALSVSGSTMLLLGPFLDALGSDLQSGNGAANVFSFLFFGDGAQVTSFSPLPFVSVTSSGLDTSGNVVSLRRSTAGTPTQLTLAGPLLAVTNSSVNHTSLGFAATFGQTSACCNAVFVGQGAQLTSTTPHALIQLVDSTVTGNDEQSGGNFFTITDTFAGAPANELVAPGSVSLQGPLLASTDSTILSLFNLLRVARGTLTSGTTSPLIEIQNGHVGLGGTDAATGNDVPGSLLLLFSSPVAGQEATPAAVTLAGPLARFTNATFEAAGESNVVSIVNGGTYTASGSAAMLQLTSTTLSGFNLLNMGGLGGAGGATPATLSLEAPFLTAVNSNITLGSNVLGVFNASRVTSTTTAPLIQLTGTSLTAGTEFGGAEILQVNGGATPALVTLNGPVFAADATSAVNVVGALFGSFAGGQLVVNGSTAPLFAFNGGTHNFGNGTIFGADTAFSLNGLETQTALEIVEEGDPDIVLELGTRKPVQAAGTLLEMTGATADTKGVMKLDTALLEASAPVLHLKGSSNLTVANDGIDLITNAKLTSSAINPLIRLDASTLTINNGHLAAVRGGSFLNVGGDFLLMNGSTLNLNNGSFLLAQGGSFVKIGGALVNFGTGGNTVNLTNNLCGSPCAVIGGLQVFLTNGAVASNVTVNSPITNPGGGTINFSNGANTAHIVVDGAATRVRIGQPIP